MDSTSSDGGEPASRFSLFCIVLIPIFFLTTCSKPSNGLVNKALMVGDSVQFIGEPTPPPVVKKPTKKKKKKIYLTFDDGPNKGTRNVLDIVQQEQVPATFFIVGEHVFASHDQARTWDSLQQATNIEICNHSYTHAHNRYKRYYEQPDSVVKEMEKTQEQFVLQNKIVRAPGRNSWRIDSLKFTDVQKSKAAMDSLQAAGFIVMGWDLEWHYDPQTLAIKNTADELLTQVDSAFARNKMKTLDHLVLLAHDQVYQKPSDSLQLRLFVQKLKLKDEYELSLVSSYPGVEN
jgi:peptidoglycan-N-acetylglucosamine deacetylase